jgi:hypothetical protein
MNLKVVFILQTFVIVRQATIALTPILGKTFSEIWSLL